MENIINFAYSGVIRIDEKNAQNILTCAIYLQLDPVRDACVDFLISR